MEKPKTTPKDFFLWAGAMVALYWSVSAFIFLMFDYINYAFPDPLNYYASNPYQGGVSFEMSSLIVLFPVFILLMWLIHRDIKRDHGRSEVWVRRWALVLTLFVAALSMIIDLVVLVHSFLNGDAITTAFVFKVLIVLLVAAAAFMHFIADYWGYWETYPSRARSVGYAAVALVVLSIAAGFLILGTPQHARLINFDEAKISDLQNIQSEITTYYQQKQALPARLSDLTNSLSYVTVPTDAQSGQAYGYQITKAPYSFELCADFNLIGNGNASSYTMPVAAGGAQDNWQHSAGQYCFARTIDPQMYPPANGLMIPVPAKAIQ
jgi:type II secretory pathway pseudopilin PulG